MKRVLVALLASSVLIAGGFVAAAVSTPGSAVAQEAADDGGDGAVERPPRGAILDEVLDQLVADDVIDVDQAEQIRAALEAKHEELREQFGDRPFRGRHHRGGFEMRGFLEDGVIDADELAQLPEGHPLTDPEGPAAEYLEDGQLSAEELEELHGQHMPRGHHGFHGPITGDEAVNRA